MSVRNLSVVLPYQEKCVILLISVVIIDKINRITMAGVVKMYNEEYKRWMAADLEDADLKPELSKIEGNDEEIKERFAVALKFGTAGLRGVLGAGTNRMNIYVVRQATQGLANWVKTQGGTQTVAISYDSRLKSDIFAKTAASVLAANGIKVRIYDALMPVPALSFATRYYECNAGIMVTASHNPAKYNGYKAYGPDGCQMTDMMQQQSFMMRSRRQTFSQERNICPLQRALKKV